MEKIDGGRRVKWVKFGFSSYLLLYCVEARSILLGVAHLWAVSQPALKNVFPRMAGRKFGV